MKIAFVLSSVLLAGLSVASLTSQASAAVNDRDEAIRSCTARANEQYPEGDNEHYGRTRTLVYESCMHDAGQAP
jgi:hypothetical protein